MSAHALRSSLTLQVMNSSTSGWSALRMTIFAARRVVPPLLMTPANASKPFMKETGPLAVPPPASDSVAERIVREVGPRAAAVLEEHALGLGEREDRLHRVLDAVDEAR